MAIVVSIRVEYSAGVERKMEADMSAEGRREQVGDAGIRLVERDGNRAMTHLRVDAEADLPRGSTSYYARTRHYLLRLVVNPLS